MTSTYCGRCGVTTPLGASCGCVRSGTITTSNTGLPFGIPVTANDGCPKCLGMGRLAFPPDPCTKCTEKDARIKELEARLEPCEVCGDIDCQDSDVAYYIRCWKEEEAKVKELQTDCNAYRVSFETLKAAIRTMRDTAKEQPAAQAFEWVLACLELREVQK